jgi:NADPH:quinone reductase-like Zn-dependent oxidoreductase
VTNHATAIKETTMTQTTTTTTEIVLPGIVPASGLQVHQRPTPVPAKGEALVEMEATGISFAEQSMRRGRYPSQPTFPFVPGYDVVGTVRAVGPDVDTSLIGTRVAAATKTGGWASHLVVPAQDLVPVPAGLDPALAEAVIVNGITAWQSLHRKAKIQAGNTILVHGANGGVGSILVQLAQHAGVRVIGTASPRHHDALRDLGVEPIDYHDPDLAARVRELAPAGVDAVFDHLGLDSARVSWSLLAPGGTLVALGTAANLDDTTSVLRLFIPLLAQVIAWSVLPNGKSATFYDFWGGHRITPAGFRRRQHEDLTAVMSLVADGSIVPPIAARIPLVEATRALELAESHTVLGKVVLVP